MNRLGDVIAGVEWRTVQCFNQTDLVLVDHGGVEKPDREKARLCLFGSFESSTDCVWMRYVPGVRMSTCGPLWPPV